MRPEPLQPDEFEPGCQIRRVAARGCFQGGGSVQGREPLQPVGQRVEGIGSFPGRCRRWIGILLARCAASPASALIPSPLLRRLRLPLPLSGRSCRCGVPLDSSGHHRAACARAGILGEGFALESVAARICREAGGRVTTNVMLRDLDLAAPNMFDARRWKWWWTAFLSSVVSSWLWGPSHHGRQRDANLSALATECVHLSAQHMVSSNGDDDTLSILAKRTRLPDTKRCNLPCHALKSNHANSMAISM